MVRQGEPDKPTLRNRAREQRAGLDMPALSRRLVERVRTLPEYAAARHVLLYLAMPGEVNVDDLVESSNAERQWYAPRCAPKRRLAVHPYTLGETPVRAGPFGIREPDAALLPETNPALLDLVLVPALLLSEHGDRLGYGGGYYDRFLPSLVPHCVTVGVLPQALVLPTLPRDPWDIPLQIVLTEQNIYRRKTV